jgi:methylated-DNA-[protein]-cysteine S-methyltransferase
VTVRFKSISSPVGELSVGVSERGVRAVSFDTFDEGEGWHRDSALCHPVFEQLEAYFVGELRDFELELDLVGTDFQRRVWLALSEIDYGRTSSYGELARRFGRPGAARAVGAANGANPVAIVLPCHRVVGSSGTLTGFAGGLGRKRWLLDHERRHAAARGDQLLMPW